HGTIDTQKTENRASHIADWIMKAVNFHAFGIEQAMPPQSLQSLKYQLTCWFCARPILRTQWQTVDPSFLHALTHFASQQCLHQFNEVIQPQEALHPLRILQPHGAHSKHTLELLMPLFRVRLVLV